MNEKLKAALIAAGFTLEQIDAMSPEAVTALEAQVVVVEDLQNAFEEGFQNADGSFDITKVTDPTFKAAFDWQSADHTSKLDAMTADHTTKLDAVNADLTAANSKADAANASLTTVQGELDGVKRDTALDKALAPYKVVSVDDFKKLVDTSGLVVGSDGVVEGLDAFMEQAKTDRPNLFATDASPNSGKGGGNFNPPAGGGTPDFSKMTLAETIAYQRQQRNK
jgi:hypothetical protein